MLQSISVGVDDSTPAADALVWADGLARVTDATLRAIHAWEMPQPPLLGPLFASFPSEETRQRQGSETLARVLSESDLQSGLEPVLRRGRAGHELVDESKNDDLLVVGRTGSGCRRLAQIVLGSTARHVINNANLAVAVVPPGAEWVDAPTVFVGIDGSASSCEALRWAVENLPKSARIHAVWALSYWSEALMDADMGLFHHAREAALPELERCIAAATGQEGSSSDRIRRTVEPGSPRHVFTNAKLEVDIVVVGKHGSSGRATSIVGSVADHVARYAPCAAIVVPT